MPGTTRKRIHSQNTTVTGGGGGGGSNPTIAWTPGDTATPATCRPTLLATTEMYTVTAQVTSKDAYVDDVAACPVDVNHNGADLIVEGITATKKDALIGFDLSAFPSSVTMISATLKFVLKTPPVVLGQAISVSGITAGTEGWAEATVKCSTKPTKAGSLGTGPTVLTTDTLGKVYSVTFSAGGLTALAARMGTTSFTVWLDNTNTTGEAVTFFDKEDVLNHPPTLDMQFTRP